MSFLRNNLVDLKNGYPPRDLSDALIPKGVVFIHVPKCAGSSVEHGLRAKFRLSRITIDSEDSFATTLKQNPHLNQNMLLIKASALRRELLHYYLEQRYKCITGHAPIFENTISAYPEYNYITILRDPIERFISHLKFNKTSNSGHGHTEEDIDTFLESPRAKIMGALYVKYFSGADMTADFTNPALISNSKETLTKINLVGFLDKLPKFQEEASALLGKKLSFGHKNQTIRQSNNQFELSQAQLDKINQLTAPDREIYDWAKETF